MKESKIFFRISLFALLVILFVCCLAAVSASEVVITNETSDGIKGSINNGNNTITLAEGTYK